MSSAFDKEVSVCAGSAAAASNLLQPVYEAQRHTTTRSTGLEDLEQLLDDYDSKRTHGMCNQCTQLIVYTKQSP
jgi:hypothetical protein